jgi:hypothetical protein
LLEIQALEERIGELSRQIEECTRKMTAEGMGETGKVEKGNLAELAGSCQKLGYSKDNYGKIEECFEEDRVLE